MTWFWVGKIVIALVDIRAHCVGKVGSTGAPCLSCPPDLDDQMRPSARVTQLRPCQWGLHLDSPWLGCLATLRYWGAHFLVAATFTALRHSPTADLDAAVPGFNLPKTLAGPSTAFLTRQYWQGGRLCFAAAISSGDPVMCAGAEQTLGFPQGLDSVCAPSFEMPRRPLAPPAPEGACDGSRLIQCSIDKVGKVLLPCSFPPSKLVRLGVVRNQKSTTVGLQSRQPSICGVLLTITSGWAFNAAPGAGTGALLQNLGTKRKHSLSQQPPPLVVRVEAGAREVWMRDGT
jgi:hypothetical protein